MNNIKSILGYMIAALCIVAAFVTFVGNTYFGKLIVSGSGITISPRITGGRVVKTIDHGDYKTEIHETVFQGLFSDREQGFIHIEWVKTSKIPDMIIEDIDYDNDKQIDFRVEYNTIDNEAKITPVNPNVISLADQYMLSEGFAIRVLLKNRESTANCPTRTNRDQNESIQL